MAVNLAWRLRSLLSESGRATARRLADRMLVPLGSIKAGQRPSGLVALTYDDGPEPDVTGRLLDLMKVRGARATFFVLTGRAERYPELIRRIRGEGHEIALHADRHDRLTTIPLRDLRRRLVAAKGLLEAMIGEPVRLFRPPFGAQSLATYLVARQCGLDVVVWGPYAEDWVAGTPAQIAARGLKGCGDGQILLLHDGLELPPGEVAPVIDRVAVLALILDGLEARGLRATTVGELTVTADIRRTAWFRP